MTLSSTSNFGKALYYPYSVIRDVNWLKMALLYWDGLRRIVPTPAVTPNDCTEVRRVVDAGLLENTFPDNYRENASQKFIKIFSSLVAKEDRDYLDPNGVNDTIDDFFGGYQNFAGNSNPLTEEDSAIDISILQKAVPVFGLHPARAMGYVFDLLESHKLAEKNGDWYTVNQEIGGFYMMCLAAEMSDKIGAPLVTDARKIGAYGEYLSFGELGKPSNEQTPSVLLKLDIGFPTPESLEHISISEILRFRERRQDEIKRFREAIENLTNEVNTYSDANQIADFFSKNKKEIKDAIKDQNAALHELNINHFHSLLSLTAPTTIASAAASLAIPPIAPAVAGVGIGISLIKWWADVRKDRREASKKSSWHYLLSMEEFVEPPVF